MKTKKQLNLATISNKIDELGLNQSRISESLNVSRESVSKWFKSENLPSAGKLLKLSKLLNLSFEEILTIELVSQPIPSFRKNGSAKISDEDIEFAIDMGNALEKLAPYFQNEKMTKPPVLNNPHNNYDYINSFVVYLKDEMNLNKDFLSVKDLISIFYKYNSIIIPVLWKENKRHANALRIHLPESQTTWIYLNLNTKIYDFKFWMAHELGHVIAPDLKNKEAESFADNFAGALLFPKNQVEKLYNKLIKETSQRQQIDIIINKGKELMISPLSVYMQLCSYSEHYEITKIDLEELIYKFNSKFHSYFPTVAVKYLKDEHPKTENYLNFVNSKFNSRFFVYLKKYIDEASPSPTFIQILLDISFVDAKNIYHALLNK